jgi:hypothetical protein
METPVRLDADPDRTRHFLSLCFLVFLIALVAGSWPRSSGDGGEYLAIALNLADVGTPWFTDADIERTRPQTMRVAQLEEWDLVSSMKTGRHGTKDFVHFWFYPALAEPFVALARAFGLSPIYGFAALNIALLVGAFWLALPRLGPWLTWMLFASPVLWWIDKAHTEIFTFSLLTIAVLLVEEAPVWALIAAGAAATQNPPILAMVPFIAVTLGANAAEQLRRPGVWMGLVGGLVLGGLAVIYYELRHGTPSLLLSATLHTLPSLRAMMVVPFDTNLGLIAAFPAFFAVLVVAVAALARTPRRLLVPSMVLVLLCLPVFLMSFAQTGNMHHGGTPGMSRYALWLIPLGIPLLRQFRDIAGRRLQLIVAVIALPSALVSTFVFHPQHPDNYREPTWLAEWAWTRHPARTNPMPEIFVDVLDPAGREQLPLAVPGCAKMLLIGRGDDQGMWPIPCYPAAIPPHCRAPNALCYANLVRGQYQFEPTEDVQQSRFKYDPARAWKKSAEAAVRKVMDDLSWLTLRTGAPEGGSVLRQVAGIDSVNTLAAPDRVLVAMVGTRDGARLAFRLPRKMTGTFVDPESGDALPAGTFDGAAGEMWLVNVPPNRDTLLLALRATGAGR